MAGQRRRIRRSEMQCAVLGINLGSGIIVGSSPPHVDCMVIVRREEVRMRPILRRTDEQKYVEHSAWHIVFSSNCTGLRLDFLLDAQKIRCKKNKGKHKPLSTN